MKKYLSLLFISLLSISLFAQTKVDAKKLGKTLESNKDSTAIFICDMSVAGMKVANDGTVTLPVFAKNKVKLVSGMDMTNITDRLNYANKKTYLVTFETTDLSSKTYSITKIDGIETLDQYQDRLVQEERKRAEEEKAKWERERLANLTKHPVQVVNLEIVNFGTSENAWLPGQVQDKLKSNLQEYLGMKTVVDSKSETALKKLQAESEDGGRDESTAIELGKITTAKFAVFTKLRKTGSGYTISIDFTDLTTGEQMASCSSKEYTKAEYLYGSTGAVDELTLSLANKLNINISDLNKNLLTSGSANFSVDAQLALAKQNEEQYQKMMKDYDAELSKLMTSNDINAIQNKNRIEAEKALLVEKQNAEKKRLEELKAQMARAAEDEKLEAERSIALKTQRDQMAKEAAAKAAEVRKLKLEKQGVLGQISVLESKKKALVEIRQGVESRSQELHEQMIKDRVSEESRIRNKNYSTVELGLDGKPTEEAKIRREKQVIKSNEDLTNKFFVDCDNIKKSVAAQEAALLAEIRADQKALSKVRTVSSMGDELRISYGKYEGSKNAWNAKVYLYSEGILIYEDGYWVNYESVTGIKPPDMKTELNDAIIEEYTNNVDMYSSLLTRGDPILYFELDYNVTAESDEKPSEYKFNFLKARIISTISGNVLANYDLAKYGETRVRTMNPQWDLREIVGVVHDEWISLIKKYRTSNSFDLNDIYNHLDKRLNISEIKVAENKISEREKKRVFDSLVKLPGKKLRILKTEVTQSLYQDVMGENPSGNEGEDYPVECVSWYDAIYFCNNLSLLCGLTPVYSVNGNTNPDKWGYTPHQISRIEGKITQDLTANGFRLPTVEEWQYAAKGGQNYGYSGSNNLDEVGWYSSNSGDRTHPVAQKKANGYGLYDMSGNVWEWCWDVSPNYSGSRYYCGGSYRNYKFGINGYGYNDSCEVDGRYYSSADDQGRSLGFRIVCSAFN